MRRILVVGLGSIGVRHARLLAERGDVHLEVCDGSPEALVRTKGIKEVRATYRSFEEALESRPDIVFLCTPTPLHVGQSKAALLNGCHVFCEKPMTTSLSEGKDLIALTESSMLHFNVGFHLHFHEGLAQVKRLLDEGGIGDLLHVSARVGTYVTLVNSATRYQRDFDGSLFGDYTHQFDLLYWLTGRMPERVFVKGSEAGSLPLSSKPNIADIFFGYDGDFQAHVHLNYIQFPQRHHYEFIGTKGWIYLDAEDNLLVKGYAQSDTVESHRYSQTRDDIYRAEHDAFLMNVAMNQRQESPSCDAIVSTALFEAVMEAYRKGEWQTIEY